jgi:hypothetical protein
MLVGLRTSAWPALPPVHYFQRILGGALAPPCPNQTHTTTWPQYNLRDKGFETPFKLCQRVLAIP